MCKEPVLYFEFGDDDYRQMWGRIHKYALDVWRINETPKASTAGCSWCDVFHSCRKYKAVQGTNQVSFMGTQTIEDL